MSATQPSFGWTRRDAIRLSLGTIAGTWLASHQVSAAEDARRVRLFVRESPIKVNGREATVISIQREGGGEGYSPDQADGFHVEVVNELKVPTCVHWHGIILPNPMDGVPFVTQEPIPPGGSMVYDFPLVQAGTYWMHSHYGLQEQFLESAPLVIWTPEQRGRADRQFVITLEDFSFTPPAEILAKLKAPEKAAMAGMAMKTPAPIELFAQAVENGKLVRRTITGQPPDIDVRYDSLLANRRAISDPEILEVEPGQTVLLRIIASSSASDFSIETGALNAEVLAVDGKDVQPIEGNYFQLAIAQRIDLLVRIPREGGAFPILAQGEGTRMLSGVVLATKGAKIPRLAAEAGKLTAALDNTQEKLLRAVSPLKPRPVDRSLAAALGGKMSGYIWTINGKAYPNRDSLDIKEGERVEIVFTNNTMMGHPMHLHGHDFQVTEIDGEKISGALRDTVEIPPNSTIKIAFDANNPGIWPLHCHIIYHLAAGMFTVVRYESAETKFWRPEESAKEILTLQPA